MERHAMRLKSDLTNRVLQIIRQAGFQESSFEWVTVKSRRSNDYDVPQLNFKSLGPRPGSFYFTFDWVGANHWIEMSPAPPDEEEVRDYGPQPDRLIRKKNATLGDKEVLQLFSGWLEALRREIQLCDLWSAISDETALIEAASTAYRHNEPFTEDEKRQISKGIHEIKEHLIQTQRLTAEKQTFVETRLSYLEEALGRLGRFDWLNLAVGVLMNIAVGVSLNPDSVRETFRIAGLLIGKVFGGGQGMLP